MSKATKSRARLSESDRRFLLDLCSNPHIDGDARNAAYHALRYEAIRVMYVARDGRDRAIRAYPALSKKFAAEYAAQERATAPAPAKKPRAKKRTRR